MDTDRQRFPIGPDLTAVLDEAGCLVLEVHEPGGRVLRRVTVTNLDFLVDRLYTLRELGQADEDRGRQARQASLVSRRTAVDQLRTLGFDEAGAYQLLSDACKATDGTATGHPEGSDQLTRVTYNLETGRYEVIGPEAQAAMLRRDMASRVHDADTAVLADFIASELGGTGVTGITWAEDPGA